MVCMGKKNRYDYVSMCYKDYVILDNLDVIEQEYVDNRYQEYYLKSSLNDILDIILNNIKKGLE